MDFDSFFSELVKLGTISDEEAEVALKRYQSLKENRPDAGQVARYSALGAATAPAMHVAGNVLKGEPYLVGVGSKYRKPGASRGLGVGRALAGSAITGAVGMGLVPIARHWMDRGAEKGKLRRYLKEHGFEQGGHILPPGGE